MYFNKIIVGAICTRRHFLPAYVYVKLKIKYVLRTQYCEDDKLENKEMSGSRSCQTCHTGIVTTYRIKSELRGNVTGFVGVLLTFGRPIKRIIRLRPEQVWTCNLTRHHRPLLSPSLHS
jgi:hypothetical protein